jgi:hypothetical protein
MPFWISPDRWHRARSGTCAAQTPSRTSCRQRCARSGFRAGAYIPRCSPRSTAPRTAWRLWHSPASRLICSLRIPVPPLASSRAKPCSRRWSATATARLPVVARASAAPARCACSKARWINGLVLSCIAHPVGQVTLASGGRPPAGTARRQGAGVGIGRPAGTVTAVRVGALVGVGALLLGSWNLTNHLPASMAATKRSAPQPTAPASGAPAATATPAGPAQGTGASGGGAHAAPTPRPIPTATSTPSPSH